LEFGAVRGRDPVWLLVVSALLAGGPIVLALTHTVPNAVQLGNRVDNPAGQTRLARSICRDHFLCLAFLSVFVVMWVYNGASRV